MNPKSSTLENVNGLQEPPTVKQGGKAPPANWPSVGTITYENVTAAYRPGLPPDLSNLSFTIQVSTVV